LVVPFIVVHRVKGHRPHNPALVESIALVNGDRESAHLDSHNYPFAKR